jgi:hypothetical protein
LLDHRFDIGLDTDIGSHKDRRLAQRARRLFAAVASPPGDDRDNAGPRCTTIETVTGSRSLADARPAWDYACLRRGTG